MAHTTTFHGKLTKENTKHHYMEIGTAKTNQLQQLYAKIRFPACITSAIAGVVGVLLLAAGVANIILLGKHPSGFALGISGFITAILAYPIYRRVIRRGERKFACEMKRLSEEKIRGEEEIQ